MTYDQCELSSPIQQGDIFRGVPHVVISLESMAVVDESDQPRELSWEEMLAKNFSVPQTVVLPVKSVYGIVITQNCDAMRTDSLSLALVDRFLDVVNQQAPSSPKKWKDLIVKKCRENLRFFYLPASPLHQLPERMAADFRTILQIPRVELERLKNLRLGRLNEVAYQHFRETLSQFFRRYPYDEWYPLTNEELKAYETDLGEKIKPFSWQS